MNHTTLAMLRAASFAGAFTFASVSLPSNGSADLSINQQLFAAPLVSAAGALLLTWALIQQMKVSKA